MVQEIYKSLSVEENALAAYAVQLRKSHVGSDSSCINFSGVSEVWNHPYPQHFSHMNHMRFDIDLSSVSQGIAMAARISEASNFVS